MRAKLIEKIQMKDIKSLKEDEGFAKFLANKQLVRKRRISLNKILNKTKSV